MSKPVQPYAEELALAQAKKLQGNQGRVQRGVTPNYVFPSGAIIFGPTATPPPGFTLVGCIDTFYTADSTQGPMWYGFQKT